MKFEFVERNVAHELFLELLNYYLQLLGVSPFDTLPSLEVRRRVAYRLIPCRRKVFYKMGSLLIVSIARCVFQKEDPDDTKKERKELAAELATLHECFPLPIRSICLGR